MPSDLDVDSLCSECPSWVCEVLSPGHRREDTVLKRTRYAQYGVAHYWIVDPHKRTMTVLQLHGTHYKEVAAFGADDIAWAEPFAATPIRLTRLFAVRN